jgi:hypothetical protein
MDILVTGPNPVNPQRRTHSGRDVTNTSRGLRVRGKNMPGSEWTLFSSLSRNALKHELADCGAICAISQGRVRDEI